jgi:hypothetical protein
MVIFFSVSAPCRLVGRYQSFEKKNILSPSSGLKMRAYRPDDGGSKHL